MSSWIDQFLGRKPKSADKAKERLKLVLIHDRTDIDSDKLEAMKNELLMVISRYVEIDPKAVQIRMTQEGREQRLVADIPIRAASRRRSG